MAALGSKSKGSARVRETSAQGTAVGSGSRPGKSKVAIPTTSPMDHKTLDRKPPKDALK